MNIIYWYPLAENLVEAIKNHTDVLGQQVFSDIAVYAGVKRDKKHPCIEVSWDAESSIKIHRPIQGNVVLWIDISIKNNSTNPSDAYGVMYHWQTEILDCLTKWQKQICPELGIAARVEVSDIISDGDVQRPICGSRLVVSIDWRNSI